MNLAVKIARRYLSPERAIVVTSLGLFLVLLTLILVIWVIISTSPVSIITFIASLIFLLLILNFFRKRLTMSNAINIISAVSMIGMGVGAMALIIVLSVFNGFEGLVLGLYNSFHPDLQVSVKEGKTFIIENSKAQQLQNIEGIAHISSVLEENAFLKYGNNSYIATIKGVDKFYTQVSGVDSTLVWGKFILNKKNINYAVLGAGVEAALAVNLENPFRSIQVYIPKRTKRGFLLPKDAFNKLPVYPAGIFSIQQDLDNKYVIVPLNFMRQLLDYQKEISALEIGLQPSADIEKVKSAIQKI